MRPTLRTTARTSAWCPRASLPTIARHRRGAGETRVTEIYPTADELPANCLRLYVHFSEPMSEGWAAAALRLRTSAGSSIEGGLLEMSPELWDRDRRRLTLLFEPGRLKRGLAPNLDAGAPLRPGQEIIFSVDSAFKDASGRDLAAGAQRHYRIGPALRSRIDPGGWRWESPSPGSREPLRIRFDRSLDRALLEHCLVVLDAAGRVGGSEVVGRAETSWTFTPDEAWRPGTYSLAIDPRLEDLAGNSLVRVFDRDLERREDDPIDAARSAVPIVIGD